MAAPLIDYDAPPEPFVPSVGAMVVNFNGGEKIVRCLQALREQVHPLEEVVVVDNGSTDGSVERIRAETGDVRIVELKRNRGLPFARNVGLDQLRTDLVLSLDSDIYLAADCLAKLVRAYVEHAPVLVCPRILLFPEGAVVQCDGAAVHFVGTLALRHPFRPIEELPTDTAFVGGCIGACMLVNRTQVLAAGGFDELFFFYFEDLEFCLKLRARGHRILCVPTAVISHDRGEGTPGLSFRGREAYPTRRAYLSMRHRWLTMLIHYRLRTLVVLMPALVAYEVATVSVALMRGWLGAWGRAWWWLFMHRGDVRARRRSAQAARSTSDRALLEGGPLPLAPGFTRSPIAGLLVRALSASLNTYWHVTRRWIG